MRLLAFGRLSHLPLNDVEIPADIADSDSLRSFVGEQWPQLNDPSVRIAVNQTLVHDVVPLSLSDEIAFLPPMSGG